MQSPRFNLDDVNDSIVIFFLLFSQMAEWRRGGGGCEGRGGIGEEEGTRCLVLVV